MKVYSLLAICLFLISACTKKSEVPPETTQKISKNEYLTQSVLWFQQSGEMMALFYQGYNLAKNNVDLYLAKNPRSKRKKAIIVDIDETVLNNGFYEAYLIRTDSTYTNKTWSRWVNAAVADTLPGAYHFLTYAKSKGIEVFYVTNRDSSYTQPTIRNLQKFNLPDADQKHVLAKGKQDNGKEARRTKIASEYEIILLCGDNLSDFYYVFDDRERSKSFQQVNAFKKEFGKRFIVFPNPMYGDWENDLYGKKEWTASQYDSLRKANLVEKMY